MKKVVKKRQLFNKRLVLNILLVLFMFLSIGYSTLSTNLNINGNLNVKKYYEHTLYNVLAKEAETGGLATKYTGEHHDSFTEAPSKDIYHWYAKNDTEGTQVLDKNNVIFANHCWQMLRTTDTGGVKMIYNGEAVDNQCLSTRGTHVGYASRTSQNLASNYWYGTDYIYDSSNKTFKVSGTTEQTMWNESNGPGLVGKYTCKNTSVDGTCSTLYLVESYYNTSSAYVIPLNSNSNYSQFGTLQFNASYNSPSYVGYMYGNVYSHSTMNSTSSESFTTSENRFPISSFSETYKYSKTINNTGSGYELVNPILGSEIPEDDYSGYYTFSSSTIVSGNHPTYLVGLYIMNSYYYVHLSPTNNLSSFYIMIGDSITDKLNGTYELTGNVTSVSPREWYANYARYKNKYTCGDATTTICSSPRYIVSIGNYSYSYIVYGEKIMIGKTRSGVTLTDTLLVNKDELLKNSSNYNDYKYTCNTENSICVEDTLRMIISYTSTGYNYAPNRYYGSSVTWDGTNYTLVDPIGIENYNNMNNISTHHYMCVSEGLKTCATVAYVYYYTGSGIMYYITLKDGVTTVDKALEDMLTKNTTNSTMKSGVDAWYKHYLLEDYDDYIEDTIFCNDRSIRALNGWNPDGGMTNAYLQFKEYNVTSDLSCANITDKFSVSNNKAKLSYKVGLLSSPEKDIINNINALRTGQYYWLGSPYFFVDKNAYERGVIINGIMNDYRVFTSIGVRPTISLKPGTKYVSGTGSMADPYIVDTSGD